MPHFSYKAKDDFGRTVKGVLASEDESSLAFTLKEKGHYLISAKEVNPTKPFSSFNMFNRFNRISRKELIAITHHLATLFTYGLPTHQGLQDLAQQTERRRLKRLLEDIGRDVEQGAILSEALESHPETFSKVYVAAIKAGEATGKLDLVLRHLVTFLEWHEDLANQLKEATTYPFIVLTFASALAVYLLTYVIPRFVAILVQSNIPLPLMTRIALDVGSFVKSGWIILGILGISTAIGMGITTPHGRRMFDQVKLNLPIFGPVIRKVVLSRFAHYFALLNRAGVDLITSLTIVEVVTGNIMLEEAIRSIRFQVQMGEPIAKALVSTGQFPPIVTRLIFIGESTGDLDETLDKICQYFDREVPTAVKRAIAVFQPLLIAFLAVIILWLAMAAYLPLWEMIRGIKGVRAL